MSSLAIVDNRIGAVNLSRFDRLITTFVKTNNQKIGSLTEQQKSDLLNHLNSNHESLESKNVSGYMTKLKVYLSAPEAPKWFNSLFFDMDYSELTPKTDAKYILNNMYYVLTNSFGRPATGVKDEAFLSRNLLVYSVACLINKFPRLTVELCDDPITTVFADYNTIAKDMESQRIIRDNKDESDGKTKFNQIKECSVKFWIYMSILHFRKHGIFNIAMGQDNQNRGLKERTIQDQFNHVYTKTNDNKYALINLRALDENILRDQYFAEFATLDCLVLWCMQTGLKNNTLSGYNSSYLTKLELLISEKVSYQYKCGSLKFAYLLCLSFYTHFIQILPDYTFKNEDGHPSRLGQFYSIHEAASKLSRVFNTGAGFSKTLQVISTHLNQIFVQYSELLKYYHEGHPNYSSPGVAAKEVWNKVIILIATIGKAYEEAIKLIRTTNSGNNQDGNLDVNSWLLKPLFRYADVSLLEVSTYKEAMIEVLTKDNKVVNNQFELSMAITSGLGEFNVQPLNLSMLAPTLLSESMSFNEQTRVQPSNNRSTPAINKPQVASEADPYGDI